MKTETLIRKTEQTIRKHGLLLQGDSVLAGFSGGPDSTCLLYVLYELRERFQLSLHALYVNHNLRPDEVPSEIAFCKRLSEDLGIGFVQKSIDVMSYCRERRMNLQEAARELRYQAFQEAADELRADRIALAHTADDQAETFFLRVLRGAGPAGLSGIPVKRGNIIRPLIEIGRQEIEEFLKDKDIVPLTDSSNLKQDYSRNMIRMSIMPVLKQANPNLVYSLSHTMAIMREEERYFDILVTKTLMKLISRKSAKRIELFLSPMETMDTVILRRVLRRAISETEGLRGIGFVHVEDLVRLVKEGGAGSRVLLPKGIRAIRDYALLVMTSEEPVTISTYRLDLPGEAVIVGSGQVLTAAYAEGVGHYGDGRSSVLLDAEKMTFPLKIRPRRAGDFFYPLGFGKKKKLQDFFVDQKVPRDERDSIPLVLSGDEIVWIAGYRADDRYRVTEKTKKFVRLGIVKGKF